MAESISLSAAELEVLLSVARSGNDPAEVFRASGLTRDEIAAAMAVLAREDAAQIEEYLAVGGASTAVAEPAAGGLGDSEGEHSDQAPAADSGGGFSWSDIPSLMQELRELAARLLEKWPGLDEIDADLLVCDALLRQRRGGQGWEAVSWPNRSEFF